MSILDSIVALSHEFGTSDYVQGGGGNASVKNETSLWIKPSGTTLGDMRVDQLLEVDRSRLMPLYTMTPPDEPEAREALITRMLAESRADQDVAMRPSVETPLHDSLEATFVVHTHPQLVGGMVCAVESREVSGRLFPDYLYVPSLDPGYTLSMQVREDVADYRSRHGRDPAAIVMENHGVLVAGNTADEVRDVYEHIMDALRVEYRQAGLATMLDVGPLPKTGRVAEIAGRVQAKCDDENLACSVGEGCFAVAHGPLSPDHIVYMKSYACFGEPTEERLAAFITRHGYPPRVVATEDAVVCFGSTPRNAQLAMDLARDGAVVAHLAQAFGGVRYMSEAQRLFIENWEAESYRRSVT